ncbi:MAG: outer membrane beta-barrel protein [Deltaproteobacteria bacterium]|nr:outer membrane beta-barrel protein [Deltaproteobacteria bacterium]
MDLGKKIKEWRGDILVSLCLVSILVPTLALAAQPEERPGNIHIGNLKIYPSVAITEEYTDNVFLESSGESGSAITTVSPGIMLQLPLRSHLFQLDYHADIIEASRHHRVYDTDSHFASALLSLSFNRLQILTGDNWESNSTIPDYETDIRNNYYHNRFFVDAIYKLRGRYELKGFYRNDFRDFDSFRKPGQFDPELDNYMQNEVGVDLFYRFMPLTSALFEYAFTHRNNEDKGLPSTDFDAHRFWLGLKWEATAKIAGIVKGGYVTRDYDGPSDDWDGFGMEVDVEYKMSPYYFLTLRGFRELRETSVTQDEGVYGTYYVSSGGTLRLTHVFTYKISAFLQGMYWKDDYREHGAIGRKRDDDRIGFGCGVHYNIQDWLKCKLYYDYIDNDSNIDPEDYKENLIGATVLFTF